MLLERYLADLLTTQFGHLIEGLESDKVRLSAWKGELVLQDVRLRRHALDHYRASPVEIVHGRIGTLYIRIPWKLVRQKSASITRCTVVLTDVDVLVAPKRVGDAAESDEEDDDEHDDDEPQESPVDKENKIQSRLDETLLERLSSSAHTAKSKWWWVELLQEQVAAALWSHLVVTVKNIHVRYEDPGTSFGFSWKSEGDFPKQTRYRPAFAVGIALKQFSIQAPAAKEKEEVKILSSSKSATQVESGAGESSQHEEGTQASAVLDGPANAPFQTRRKVAAADQLAAYWDSDSHIVAKFEEIADDAYYRSAFSRLNQPDSSKFASHSFVLDPFSPFVDFALVEQVLNETTGSVTDSTAALKPPSTMDFKLPPCRLSISRTLLEDLGYLRQSYAVWKQNQCVLSESALRRLARLRPKESPLFNPRGWWRYTLEAVTALQRISIESSPSNARQGRERPSLGPSPRRRVGWLGLARALGDRKRYIDLYRRFLFEVDENERRLAHVDLLKMERDLSVDEAVAFRMTTHSVLKLEEFQDAASPVSSRSQNATRFTFNRVASAVDRESDDPMSEFPLDDAVLSMEHRSRSFAEVARALTRAEAASQTVLSDNAAERLNRLPSGVADAPNIVLWTTSLTCEELSLQVDDRSRATNDMSPQISPVARLSCAVAFVQHRYRDGSWELKNQIGSLVVKDCAASALSRGPSLFPNLVGPKGGRVLGVEKTMLIDGKSFYPSVEVTVRRSTRRLALGQTGSTTATVVRVLPFEIVYSTAPVEALSRILGTANVELSNDYHRIVSRLFDWRERQRRRLMRALAHRQKKILVDLDIGAPVLLLPERSDCDSPLVVVDLGRLEFGNDGEQSGADMSSFDDKWRLDLTNIQVLCTTTTSYRARLAAIGDEDEMCGLDHAAQQLIEPFSLEFAISTSIKSDDDDERESDLSAQVLASLPRLAINVTTSAARLMRRLQKQWEARKGETDQRRAKSIRFDRASLLGFDIADVESRTSRAVSVKGATRWVDFQLVAPLLRIRFENDVDGRDCRVSSAGDDSTPNTPLVDLILRGIEGRLRSERSSSGQSLVSWVARLRSLDAIDLYQGAGDGFAFLLSSVSPVGPDTRGRFGLESAQLDNAVEADLVTFEYESDRPSNSLESLCSGSKSDYEAGSRLQVKFHELYVEWNPETLAALQVAMNLPHERKSPNSGDDESDVFFDAEEDEFFEAEPDPCAGTDARRLKRESALADIGVLPGSEPDHGWTRDTVPPFASLSTLRELLGPVSQPGFHTGVVPVVDAHAEMRHEVVFELSKLRVHFNKESRHRRLLVVEMDRTAVTHTILEGRSTTRATIGNLSFADADSLDGTTLYRDILGLKTESSALSDGQSSLLEMELVRNKRTRRYFTSGDSFAPKSMLDSVEINLADNAVYGCDYFLRAHFSPMRFVYLQQLWFEIIDYFFEGIMGYEVWGNPRPDPGQPSDPQAEAPNADSVTFTKFDVVMESPVLLIPVTYCSTDFVRLEMMSMAFSNFYEAADSRTVDKDLQLPNRQQWFNNCEVAMHSLEAHCSAGRRLSSSDDAVSVSMTLNWPTGPAASENIPKWRVNCCFDPFSLALKQQDYALLQHVVQHNIGEESRHLDEWHALQNLPPLVFERYKQDIMVHFGYDKKDVTPTTFDVSVSLPGVRFKLLDKSDTVADVRCTDVLWTYKKLADLVSHQKVTCAVDIVDSMDSGQILLSACGSKAAGQTGAHHLTYTSVSQPSGDSTKGLEFSDSRIHLIYPAWRRFGSFFSGLPGPNYLSPAEAIQVGDRWYKITHSSGPNSVESSRPRLSWLSASEPYLTHASGVRARTIPTACSYEFRLSLRNPSVYIGWDSCALIICARDVLFEHFGHAALIRRDFRLAGVELQTKRRGRRNLSEELSLLEPWTVAGSVRCCNGVNPCRCATHSLSVSADQFKARAAYSDLIVALEVTTRLIVDVRNSQTNTRRESDQGAKAPSGDCVSRPSRNVVEVKLEELRVVVVDDSGRHFAGAQELVVVSAGGLEFDRSESKIKTTGAMTYSMALKLLSVDVVDCLQAVESPFRAVAMIRAAQALLPEELMVDSGSADPKAQYAVELSSTVDTVRRYDLRVRAVDAQYNPSLIVALQRFLGRLSKDAKIQLDTLLQQDLNASSSLESASEATSESPRLQFESKGCFDIECIRVCLNKEHQGRQLLEIAVADCRIELCRSSLGLDIQGHLGLFDAWENDQFGGLGRNVVKVGGESEHFLDFHYRTFSATSRGQSRSLAQRLPEWVAAKIAGDDDDDGIDDCLEVSVAALEVTYVKDRALELVDYLSNGMPGKGMGATSRAAKGFVNKRIQTKSFLQVFVDAPKVLFPRDELAQAGVTCVFGDLNLKSWIQEEAGGSSSVRMLTVGLTGLSAGLYDFGSYDPIENYIFSDVNIGIDVEKSQSRVDLRMKVSDVRLNLRYRDFVTLVLVSRENIGRRIDTKQWDNLEAAWEEEISRDAAGTDHPESPLFSTELSYSKSARLIRYGQRSGAQDSSKESRPFDLDLRLQCNRVSLLLYRNDGAMARDGDSDSELAFIAIRRLSAFIRRLDGAGNSVSASLGKVFLLDMGRNRRGDGSGREWRRSDPLYSVMIEGYHAPDGRDSFDSQVVVTVDSDPKSKDVQISVVVNYLSLAALLKPLEDLKSFFTRAWDVSDLPQTIEDETESLNGQIGQPLAAERAEKEPPSGQPRVQINFVLHYPRLILIADSRGLVLQGLALLNATTGHGIVDGTEDGDGASVLRVQADFQNISSHINPNVARAIALQQRHIDLVSDCIPRERLAHYFYAQDPNPDEADKAYGIPLLLPLTISLELEQRAYPSSPAKRSLAINVDKLSMMLSGDDLKLIDSVVQELRSRSSSSKQHMRLYVYEVMFESERLGLGLRKEGPRIVVDHVGVAAREKSIESGDVVYAINGALVVASSETTLSEIVSRLALAPRPLSVTFARPVAGTVPGSDDRLSLSLQRNVATDEMYQGSFDRLDVSISSATVTLMEKEVTLFRGQATGLDLGCRLERTDKTVYHVDVSSMLEVDYYNLRVWDWEPLLEPGALAIAAEYQDSHRGPRELSIEIGDRPSGPLCFNLSDSAAETMSKIWKWREEKDDQLELYDVVLGEGPDETTEQEPSKGLVSKNAANAALVFAQRQKSDSAKPFVFRNLTGVSIAFAQQTKAESTKATPSALTAVGDYHGLREFSDSDITIVANGEEAKFRVNVLPDSHSSGRGRRFPLLTVAFQSVANMAVDPLKDLDVSSAGEMSFPLACLPIDSHLTRSSVESREWETLLPERIASTRRWISWHVDQADERTVLTLATSVQIASCVKEAVEIGIEELNEQEGRYTGSTVQLIGVLHGKDTVHMPLWLALKKSEWRALARFAGGFSFVPLFRVEQDGTIVIENAGKTYVECPSDEERLSSKFFALSCEDNESMFAVTLDSGLSLRNLLPAPIQWEIAEAQASFTRLIDGSALRSNYTDVPTCNLQSGEKADVFSDGFDSLHLRFRLLDEPPWSGSVSLTTRYEASELEASVHGGIERMVIVRKTEILDAFGLPLSLGVRIAKKERGVDVAVFAELWCSNLTSLPLVFGCPLGRVLKPEEQGSQGRMADAELSAAEAALKEISSLFELGEDGKGMRVESDTNIDGTVDIVRVPVQTGVLVCEECFEYVDVEGGSVKRRWFASENSRSFRLNMIEMDKEGLSWQWLDDSWRVDTTGRTVEGWESSNDLEGFVPQRVFKAKHRYRRRRWIRARTGSTADRVDNVSAFFQPEFFAPKRASDSDTALQSFSRVAVQVDGGKWAVTSIVPRHGTVYGALRAAKCRWPTATAEQKNRALFEHSVYELCYSVSPLDGDWCEAGRLMLFTSRFLLRNDSSRLTIEVKQNGLDDSTAIRVAPGKTEAFHWGSFLLPELICVRPAVESDGAPVYKWSGGFDPLTIGVMPVRVRKSQRFHSVFGKRAPKDWQIKSLQVESEIRPKTGGTGINICFYEEDELGAGALFRIENQSTFPIWFSQDGLIANHSLGESNDNFNNEGDLVRPSETTVFALDVPFRQGKYSGRKAATMAELLRVRLALAPLCSRIGIETTKVASLMVPADRVRLNPSKIMFLSPSVRSALRQVRILGFIINDGPTRVLRFSLIAKEGPESLFTNPFQDDAAVATKSETSKQLANFTSLAIDAAEDAVAKLERGNLPVEEDTIQRAIFELSQTPSTDTTSPESTVASERDLIISIRVALQGLFVSIVDSSPSEICLASLKNVNILASWNTLRTTASTVYLTVASLQVDNMLPNAPFSVAVCPSDLRGEDSSTPVASSIAGPFDSDGAAPLLVVGVSFAPRHKSGIVCIRSVTIAPRNLSINIDLAFLVRLQKYVLDLLAHFEATRTSADESAWASPDLKRRVRELDAAAGASAAGRQKFYFGGLTIMPCNIKLSVAPARALTTAQAQLEGEVAAAIHQAVRKGDVKLGDSSALLGVKLGHRNATPLAVVRGVFKSIVVDALLRLDGANLNFAGVSLRNHISTSSQLSTQLGAHYLASLRQNLPAVLGSLAAFGNPIGLVRGLGDGVSDFVLEPVKGFQRSVQEMDATHLVDGVARGTLSLARHTVGGFADSAAMLSETFSKNMTVLTLDRRYAQKRDRKDAMRDHGGMNVAVGLGSGVQKLAQGFFEGVTGVVKAPLRGAEKKGFEGFAKGVGKGLLGLLVKPIIGISDGFTDVMIGVKGSIGGVGGSDQEGRLLPIRPRRVMYGTDRVLRTYNVADAAAMALMLRTRLAGECYLGHLDMGNRVALLSVKRLLLLGPEGEELLVLKFKHIEKAEVRSMELEDKSKGWGIVVILNTPRRNGSEVEVINCKDKAEAEQLMALIELGIKQVPAERQHAPLFSGM